MWCDSMRYLDAYLFAILPLSFMSLLQKLERQLRDIAYGTKQYKVTDVADDVSNCNTFTAIELHQVELLVATQRYPYTGPLHLIASPWSSDYPRMQVQADQNYSNIG